MKTVTDLRDELATLYDNLKNDKVGYKIASQMNRAARHMISSARLQLEHSALTGVKPIIPFLK